jgi:hypothetical protein
MVFMLIQVVGESHETRRFAIDKMKKSKEQINKEIKEWIDSNRKNKTRIKFEMQDRDDPNISYSFTLGQLFDIAYEMGVNSVSSQ